MHHEIQDTQAILDSRTQILVACKSTCSAWPETLFLGLGNNYPHDGLSFQAPGSISKDSFASTEMAKITADSIFYTPNVQPLAYRTMGKSYLYSCICHADCPFLG